MAVKRDTDFFQDLIEQNKGIIYKVANAYCKSEENRKDLIQEILIQIWLSIDKYDDQYKISTWMYRIALNVSISFYRKERRRDEINNPIPDNIYYLSDENLETESTELTLLKMFIRELKELDRAVIILYLEKNSYKEIADILGLSVTNVATKVGRIKQQLKKKFEEKKDLI